MSRNRGGRERERGRNLVGRKLERKEGRKEGNMGVGGSNFQHFLIASRQIPREDDPKLAMG